jgi:hypothetical protein
MPNNSSDQLGIIIDPRDYKTFAGPDWPSYQRLIAGDHGNTAPIQAEVQDFIKMMQETYQARVLHGDVLAQSNQQRQKQIFFDNFWGFGFGGVCLGGEVGSRDTLASQNVHVGGADIGLVDHGVWTDGECPADLASFGAKGLP